MSLLLVQRKVDKIPETFLQVRTLPLWCDDYMAIESGCHLFSVSGQTNLESFFCAAEQLKQDEAERLPVQNSQ